MSPEEYQRLTKAVESHRRKADMAAGSRDQLLKELEMEFGCNTIEEGERLARKLKLKLVEKESELKEAYARFVKEHGDDLGL